MKKRRRITTKGKIIILIFISCVFFGATLFIMYSFNSAKGSIKDYVAYNESANLDPIVCLSKNNFISSECKKENVSYVTALIDKMYVDYHYNINGSKKVRYSYTYIVKANVKATEKGESSKVVYNKDHIIKKETVKKKETSSITIRDRVPVNFRKYNDTITAFKRNYVLALDSVLTITAKFKIHGEYDGIDADIDASPVIEVSLPLSEQTVNINKEKSSFNHENSIAQLNKSKKYNKTLITRTIYVIDALLIIVMVIMILKLRPKQKMYTKKMKKIKRDYDNAVVMVKRLPDVTDLKIIEVETFEELVDARDNLSKPILLCENINKDKATFILINNNEAFVYALNAFEVNKDENKKKI